MEQRGNGACVALHPLTKSCTIYERRPKACRDFKRADPPCRKAVAGSAAALLRDRNPA
jgi:Fe-S-cluster containining protein